jgi:hypothetical protein
MNIAYSWGSLDYPWWHQATFAVRLGVPCGDTPFGIGVIGARHYFQVERAALTRAGPMTPER